MAGKLIDIEVEVNAETEKAWLVYNGDKSVWIAKSQAEIEIKSHDRTGVLTLPEWLAIEKELV